MDGKFNVKEFTQTVSTSVLPARVSEVIRAAVIERMIEVKRLREYGFVSKAGEGAATFTFSVADAIGDAFERGEIEDFQYDAAGLTNTTKTIIEIGKGFKISWPADRVDKLDLRVKQTRAAVDKVIDYEDKKILTALTTASALSSTVSAAGNLSATSANPLADLKQAKRKIRALIGTEADMLFVEEVNLEELITIVGSNDWYKMTEDAAANGELPKFAGLKIVSIPAAKMAHGTAIIFKSGSYGAYELAQGHDVRTLIFDDKDSHCTKVQVYERGVPCVVRADAGAKLINW